MDLLEGTKMNALSAYLSETLSKCIERDKSQQAIFCAWLVELYLSKLTFVCDIESSRVCAALRLFLCQHSDVLHIKTTFQLIASHGCDIVAAPLAEEMKVYELLVAHFMHEHSFITALLVAYKSALTGPLCRLESRPGCTPICILRKRRGACL